MAAEDTASSENSVVAETPVTQRKNLLTLIREWPLQRKIALGSITILSIGVFAFLILQARVADYQLLYANLSEADAGSVVNWLKSQKIPYELKNSGKNIWIGADKIYETRFDLASNGLPSGGGVGFEVFDKQSFALTDYVQKVNYTRALQGELARTITSLAPVESTRVHLALPEKRLFKNQQKNPTASVIITMSAGRELDPNQVEGIIHLVSGSITGLLPEHVKVIDSNGVVLEGLNKKGEDNLLSVDILAFQQEVEHRLEMRAQDLLDTIMGKNKAMVRVTAVLDFNKVEKTQELFDSDEPVIRSEQVNQENSGSQTSGGIPGVQSNLQGNTSSQSGSSPPSNSSSRVTNYEISKTISKIVAPVGTIQNLSVSILVADREVAGEDGQTMTTAPLAKKELQSIEKMVSSALGIDSARGDKINVVSMPFNDAPQDAEVAEKLPSRLIYEYMPVAKIALIAIGALLFYFLLLRPIIKTMRTEVVQHYKTVKEMEKERLELEKAQYEEEYKEKPLEGEDAVRALRREVNHNPIPTAYIIKNWIQES